MVILRLPTPDGEEPSPYFAQDGAALIEMTKKQIEDFLEEHPDKRSGRENIPITKLTTLLAEGGPYHGMELNLPPNGSQVVLPGAFGAGDYHGPVIYERESRPGGDRMVFVGQPEQPDPEDDE